MKVIEELKKTYIMKGVGIPSYYLGGDVEYLDEHWKKEGIAVALSVGLLVKHQDVRVVSESPNIFQLTGIL